MLLELLSAISTKMLYLILHIENAGSFPKPLSAKEERKALEQMASGDAEAKNRLIEHNLRLVAHIIKRYYASYSDQEDLISIGTIGLIKGINSFDYTRVHALQHTPHAVLKTKYSCTFAVKKSRLRIFP